VPRALDVRELLLFGGSADVVDGGEMEEVLDLALELLRVRVGDARFFWPSSPMTAITCLSSAPQAVRCAASFFSEALRTST